MFGSDEILNLVAAGGFLAIALLAIALAYYIDKTKGLRGELNKVNKSLDEMDEQAKLIVRTDIELNKTQEELDKKISGLYALQRFSREISTTLEENLIFKIAGSDYLKGLGFEKSCIFIWNMRERRFLPKAVCGYQQKEINSLEAALIEDPGLSAELTGLINKGKSVSSSSCAAAFAQAAGRALKSSSFIISPLLPKEGDKGLFFAGTENTDAPVTEGDEELITILSSQIGQALENARLFEKAWRTQQGLEEKIEERTEDLKLALKKVEIINKRKTDFISSVSHELRTPLTSIKGYASILLAGKLGSVPAEIQERLEKINRHSDELVHMVNDLLDIARIESGKVLMNKEQLDLKEVADKIFDLLSVQLKDKNIEFSSSLSGGSAIVFADRSQTERIFINIIGNAIKFTPQKGKIIVSSRHEESGVQVDISDTGCGIPQQAQEAIFEEFYRVDNPINEVAKGTGLGLALVKRIVEAHGGRIWVKSRMGAGSTFSFILPRP